MSNFKNKKVLSALLSLSLAFEPMAFAQNNTKNKSENSLCNKIVQKVKKVVTYPVFYIVKTIYSAYKYSKPKVMDDSRTSDKNIKVKAGYNILDENEKIIYDIIIKNCDFKNLEVNITEDKEYIFKISKKFDKKLKKFIQDNHDTKMGEHGIFILNLDKTEKIYGAIRLDHPELFWISSLDLIEHINDKLEFCVYSIFSTDEIRAKRFELKNKVNEILNQMYNEIGRNATDYDKAKYIHDYICKNCRYFEYPKEEFIAVKWKVQTAYGCLCEGKAVCDGISKAYQLLMNRAGVDCRTISGTSREDSKGFHAWNIVKINGKWYHVDVTWDLPYTLYENYVLHGRRYKYFLLTNEEIQEDHRIGISYGNGNDEYINANGHRNFNLPKEIAEGIKRYQSVLM
ncbi:MAG: transglutaminase domain-containing protein [Clostridia bacterium]|nr:transglutaminase domain-containing protein [Clostridia bacterium]